MEGPGGYQLVGRTVQMWNPYRVTTNFEPGCPWLLRFFDQVRFFPVSAADLLEMREAFPYGVYQVEVESTPFTLRRHYELLSTIASDAARFKIRQRAAYLAERERWAAAGQPEFVTPPDMPPANASTELPDGCEAIRSPVTGSVCQMAVKPGQRVESGQKVVVLEAMKMEIVIVAPVEGIVEIVHCAKGGMVLAGQNLATVKTARTDTKGGAGGRASYADGRRAPPKLSSGIYQPCGGRLSGLRARGGGGVVASLDLDCGPGAGPRARAHGRPVAAPGGSAIRGQGQHRHWRGGAHSGVPVLCVYADTNRERRAPPARGGRHSRRQDQHGSVCDRTRGH